MLQILGKSTSINVRKVLWLCEELELPYELRQWGSGHLAATQGRTDLLPPAPAERALERPSLPAVAAYYERSSQRPAFMAHGRNGVP